MKVDFMGPSRYSLRIYVMFESFSIVYSTIDARIASLLPDSANLSLCTALYVDDGVIKQLTLHHCTLNIALS